jgi:outer membrane protein
MNVEFRRPAAFAVLLAWSVSASAQTPSALSDATRQDALVREAVARYEASRQNLEAAAEAGQRPAGTPAPGGIREIRLDDVVQLALEKNLDIAVERLSPQSVDLQIAQIRNSYLPVASSAVGQRNFFQLPRDQLQGGQRVSIATTTYNAGIAQNVPFYGGTFAMAWNNNKQDSSSTFNTFNPTYTTGLTMNYTQPLLRGLFIDATRQQLRITQINREISEETLRATIITTMANVRNAYWDLVFAQSAVEVALRATELADKLVEDNQARVEVGTLAPLDIVQAQAEAATRRQNLAAAEAAAQTAEIALKRFLVSGTDDPLWQQTLRPVDLPSLAPPPADVEGAVRRGLDQRTDILNARRGLDTSDINIRYFKDLSMPALDLTASYGAQGIGGPVLARSGTGIGSEATGAIVEPGGYFDALSLLRAREYPNWNFSVNMTYPLFGNQAEAQHARARLQRNQSLTRIRALEVQIAAEITNAALTVQSNLKRVEAATAARELALKRLEAEQSKFDVGMTTNFFVVQAQRDLRDAQNTELRALADYRKSLVNYERAQQSPAGGGGGNFGGQQQQQ